MIHSSKPLHWCLMVLSMALTACSGGHRQTAVPASDVAARPSEARPLQLRLRTVLDVPQIGEFTDGAVTSGPEPGRQTVVLVGSRGAVLLDPATEQPRVTLFANAGPRGRRFAYREVGGGARARLAVSMYDAISPHTIAVNDIETGAEVMSFALEGRPTVQGVLRCPGGWTAVTSGFALVPIRFYDQSGGLIRTLPGNILIEAQYAILDLDGDGSDEFLYANAGTINVLSCDGAVRHSSETLEGAKWVQVINTITLDGGVAILIDATIGGWLRQDTGHFLGRVVPDGDGSGFGLRWQTVTKADALTMFYKSSARVVPAGGASPVYVRGGVVLAPGPRSTSIFRLTWADESGRPAGELELPVPGVWPERRGGVLRPPGGDPSKIWIYAGSKLIEVTFSL